MAIGNKYVQEQERSYLWTFLLLNVTDLYTKSNVIITKSSNSWTFLSPISITA